MAVRWNTIGLFITGDLSVKVVFEYQLALGEKVESIVYRRSTYMIVAGFHVHIERLSVKMVLPFVDLREDCKTFRRFSEPVILEIRLELFDYLFKAGCRTIEFAHGHRFILLYSLEKYLRVIPMP